MPTLNADGNITISAADIRNAFPAFSDAEQYPDGIIENSIEMAKCFISDTISGCCPVSFECRALMLELMSAHILSLQSSGSSEQGGESSGVSGMITAATIADVHVNTAVPADQGQLQWYLNQTPYGQQLFALLKIKSSPLYFGGSRQRIFNKWR